MIRLNQIFGIVRFFFHPSLAMTLFFLARQGWMDLEGGEKKNRLLAEKGDRGVNSLVWSLE